MIKKTLFALAAFTLAAAAQAGTITLLDEGFESGAPAGWVQKSANTATIGNGWYQGFVEASTAQAGSAASYLMADYLTPANGSGNFDLWLITPQVTLINGASLSFFTKTMDPGFLDHLQVYFSAGTGTDLAGFTTLLTTIGANGDYPTDWAQFTATLSDSVSGAGRFAFRYTGNYNDADAIGLDSVTLSTVPEPGSLALLGLGAAGLLVARRKQQRA